MEKDSALYEAPSLLVFEKRHGDGAGSGMRPDDRAEHADRRLPVPFGVEVVIFFPVAIPLCSTTKDQLSSLNGLSCFFDPAPVA